MMTLLFLITVILPSVKALAAGKRMYCNMCYAVCVCVINPLGLLNVHFCETSREQKHSKVFKPDVKHICRSLSLSHSLSFFIFFFLTLSYIFPDLLFFAAKER